VILLGSVPRSARRRTGLSWSIVHAHKLRNALPLAFKCLAHHLLVSHEWQHVAPHTELCERCAAVEPAPTVVVEYRVGPAYPRRPENKETRTVEEVLQSFRRAAGELRVAMNARTLTTRKNGHHDNVMEHNREPGARYQVYANPLWRKRAGIRERTMADQARRQSRGAGTIIAADSQG
jgi:hypothetical protein